MPQNSTFHMMKAHEKRKRRDKMIRISLQYSGLQSVVHYFFIRIEKKSLIFSIFHENEPQLFFVECS